MDAVMASYYHDFMEEDEDLSKISPTILKLYKKDKLKSIKTVD